MYQKNSYCSNDSNYKLIYKIINESNGYSKNSASLKLSFIDTPIGTMIAISDEEALHLLEFANCDELESEIKQLNNTNKKKLSIIIEGNSIINSIKNELELYFNHSLQEFKTPLFVSGSQFQKQTWRELIEIPYGTTTSYFNIAKKIGKCNSYRAIGNTNKKNKLAIIIPCHRVIHHNKKVGGYKGGSIRKKWLINHEQSYIKNKLSKLA